MEFCESMFLVCAGLSLGTHVAAGWHAGGVVGQQDDSHQAGLAVWAPESPGPPDLAHGPWLPAPLGPQAVSSREVSRVTSLDKQSTSHLRGQS